MRKLLLSLVLLLALPLGAAYDFDGTNDRIDLTNNGVANIDVDLFSMALTFRADAPTSNGLLMTTASAISSGNSAADFKVSTGANNKISFEYRFSGGIGSWSADTTLINDSAIHRIVAVYDRSVDTNDPTIYVDGILQSITEFGVPSGTKKAGVDSIRFGETVAGTQDFDGLLSEFAFWDVLLTADEAKAYTKGFSAELIRPDSLQVYVPFLREARELIQRVGVTVTAATPVDHPGVIMPTQPVTGFAAAAVPPAGKRRIIIISEMLKYAPAPILAGGLGLAWVINRRNKLLRGKQ